MSVRQFDSDKMQARRRRQQSLILMQTGKTVFLGTYSPYLLRKSATAAVINNLVLSAALPSFQASQLAAWLSPPALPIYGKSQMETRRSPSV